MRIAAYQAPLLSSGSTEAIGLIQERLHWCESQMVGILCCPEAILGGLADYAARPGDFALDASDGQLSAALAPLISETVTTVVGFTEVTAQGTLYNSAAVFHKGLVAGVYRKLHRRSENRSTRPEPRYRFSWLMG